MSFDFEGDTLYGVAMIWNQAFMAQGRQQKLAEGRRGSAHVATFPPFHLENSLILAEVIESYHLGESPGTTQWLQYIGKDRWLATPMDWFVKNGPENESPQFWEWLAIYFHYGV